MDNELATITATTPATLLTLAVQQGADLDRLERLMDLQIKWEANEARKDYTAAMSTFKKDPPVIEKDKHVEYRTTTGMTKYDHASLGNIMDQLNPALGKCDLSAGWMLDQTDKEIKVTAKLTHINGHFETTSLSAAFDKSGGKNDIQALGSAIQYLERYTVLALTGMSTRDMDDDGQGTSEEPIFVTPDQIAQMAKIIEEKAVDVTRFLKFINVEAIDKIKAADFNKAMASLTYKKPPAPSKEVKAT